MVRWPWVNLQCRGVGQGPFALAVGVGGVCLDIFTFLCLFSPLSSSLWETVRYRLKYCLKRPLNQKQPTNHFGGIRYNTSSLNWYFSKPPSSLNHFRFMDSLDYSEGSKIRFPSKIHFQKCREEIAASPNAFCNRMCKREHVECYF